MPILPKFMSYTTKENNSRCFVVRSASSGNYGDREQWYQFVATAAQVKRDDNPARALTTAPCSPPSSPSPCSTLRAW